MICSYHICPVLFLSVLASHLCSDKAMTEVTGEGDWATLATNIADMTKIKTQLERKEYLEERDLWASKVYVVLNKRWKLSRSLLIDTLDSCTLHGLYYQFMMLIITISGQRLNATISCKTWTDVSTATSTWNAGWNYWHGTTVCMRQGWVWINHWSSFLVIFCTVHL